jgi:hypothetical protein
LTVIWELVPNMDINTPLSDKSGSYATNICKKYVVYTEQLLSFEQAGALDAPGRGCLCNQLPQNIAGHRV